MRRRLALCLLAVAAAARLACASQITVPIYIEDSHAGSFYRLAEHLDLDEPCTLIHFDTHSDASAVFDSDEIRTRLRRVASVEERGERLREWRRRGAVQCFDWIEPLMPAPVARVIWVPSEHLTEAQLQPLEREAQQQLDGQLEAAPRVDGRFAARLRVRALDQLATEQIDGPIIVTVDLDYFAQYPRAEQAAAFERVWNFVSQLRNLRAITIAISRPYLHGDEEAAALLDLALRAALSLPTASIRFEPFANVGNDRSLRAREYRAEGREVPAFDLARVSPQLKGLLLAASPRIIRDEPVRWQQWLETSKAEAAAYHLAIADHEPSTDSIWRLAADERVAIEVHAQPWNVVPDQVEWFAQLPLFPRCNLTAKSADEIGFAQGAPPRPRWRDVKLPCSAQTLPIAELRQFFEAKRGCGALRIFARVRQQAAIRATPVMEIRRSFGTGFRAALTEQFGLPYLYGSGQLREGGGDNTGPETGWGADCANFLVAALRRQGVCIPWSNPRQLRRYLEPIGNHVVLRDGPRFSPEDVERGVFLHFGSHVAALMEDRPPLGQLNAEDVVAHQLEGVPELIAIGELLQKRHESTFDLMRTPASSASPDLTVGGDVMLARSVGDEIRAGADPFAAVADVLQRTTLRAINLECVISEAGDAKPEVRYPLRAPPDAIATLMGAGLRIVGMANNHAHDFGDEALLDAVARLRAAGATVIGAGITSEDAYAAQIVTSATGIRIVILAVNDVAKDADGDLVAKAANRSALADAIRNARGSADLVVAMVHWGEENTSVVTDRQRELARWLINEGVDVVAGSHPHCIQPLDFYHGRPIAYSLGNFVFDGAPTVPGWNEGQLLEISCDAKQRRGATVRMVPIHLDARGFPHAAPIR